LTNADDYRRVMRNLASGVTVVSAVHDQDLFGMTATAFTSVSLEPMLVQVSLDTTSRTHDAVRSSGMYGVNILAEDQIELARSFAEAGIERFEDIDYRLGETGLPLLNGAIGTLECRVTQQIPSGDHTIFVGELLYGDSNDRPPLIYFQGGYRGLS